MTNAIYLLSLPTFSSTLLNSDDFPWGKTASSAGLTSLGFQLPNHDPRMMPVLLPLWYHQIGFLFGFLIFPTFLEFFLAGRIIKASSCFLLCAEQLEEDTTASPLAPWQLQEKSLARKGPPPPTMQVCEDWWRWCRPSARWVLEWSCFPFCPRLHKTQPNFDPFSNLWFRTL